MSFFVVETKVVTPSDMALNVYTGTTLNNYILKVGRVKRPKGK